MNIIITVIIAVIILFVVILVVINWKYITIYYKTLNMLKKPVSWHMKTI